MKKKVKLIILLIAVLIISGCTKYEGTMVINKDKSMNITYTYGIDKKYSKDLDLLSSKNKRSLEENGFKIETLRDDKYVGYKITKKIDNIDNISTKSDTTYSISNVINENSDVEEYFQIKRGLFKDEYKATFRFDTEDAPLLTDYKNKYENLNEEQKKELDLSFKVVLPYEAISSNATKVNGKELVWDLSKNASSNIEFEFSIRNNTNIMITIVVVIIIAVCLAISIIKNFKHAIMSFILREKKPKVKKQKEKVNYVNEIPDQNVSDENPFKGMFDE